MTPANTYFQIDMRYNIVATDQNVLLIDKSWQQIGFFLLYVLSDSPIYQVVSVVASWTLHISIWLGLWGSILFHPLQKTVKQEKDGIHLNTTNIL